MDIKSYYNKYKNKPVFMIGNGPSLSETPLDKLKGMYSFAMNRISLMYDKVSWRPSCFICTTTNIAHEEWRRDIIQTISLGIPSFVWDRLMQYVEPYHFKNAAYINCTHGKEAVDYAPDDWWSYDASQRVCKFGTSMLPALQIAIYMGFNPIYLVGCDLGFKPPIQVIDNGKMPHDQAKRVQKDPNHFAANYGTPGFAPDVLNRNMRAAHTLARQAAERIGVQIYNATLGGDLDVYPRVDLNKVLNSNTLKPLTKKKIVNTTKATSGSQLSITSPDRYDILPQNTIWRVVKEILPSVEQVDINQAIKAISAINKGIKGRHCGAYGDKLLQYLTIAQYVRSTNCKTVNSIETGTLYGGSCLAKLIAMRDLDVEGKVVCIDPMSGFYNEDVDPNTGLRVDTDIFYENLKTFGFSTKAVDLRTFFSTDNQAIEGLKKESYATLMIDGDHSYQGVRSDWEIYHRFVTNNGIVLFHDYTHPAWPDLTRFIIELSCSLPLGWKELGCFGTTLLLGRDIRKSQESAILREQKIEQHQGVSDPLCHPGFSQDELVVTPNVRPHASNRMLSTSDGSFASSDMLPKTSDNKLVKVNLIDVGSAGELPRPWSSHKEKIDKKLTFEPREAASISKDVISISACLWETAEERNFYIIRGGDGVGSSLFMPHYDYVLQNFESLKQRGSKALPETWLERSLPVDVQRVQCKTLDDVLDELNLPYPFHFMKIDAQGAEYQILKGGQKYLRNDCYGLQLELFVLPLYKGIGLLDKVASYLDSLGFEMVKKYPAHGTFASQHECVFLRRGLSDEVMQSIRRIYGLPALPSAELKYDSDAAPVSRKFSTAIQSGSPSGAACCLQQCREAADRPNIVAAAPVSDSLQQQPIPKQALDRSRELLAAFHNSHRGQRCVIIGNGPSLNKMDLSFLKNEITFGMNRIYLLFDKWDFRPTYYVSVNPLVIEQSVEEIRQISAPKFLAMEGLPFIGTAEENIFIQRKPGGAHFSDDPRKGCWWPTVTYAAMQLAYFMGFSEVILIGVDHYFKTTGDANKEIVSDGVDENHFHPDYFGKGIRWNLPDLEKSEVAYRLAKQAFEADGRRIVDATVDGHLTIFPKVDYKQIFDCCLPIADCRLPVQNRKSQIENRKSPEYLVSAIVSTYNSERFLRGCLDDLEQQTIADKMEIIVVNSGSQENEEAIIREYQQKYNNIVYIKTEQREGIYTAWNRAVKAARGKFITNANTDDRHRKDALEIMAETLLANPDVALVYGDQICTDTPNGTFDNHHAAEMAKRPEYSRERLLFGCCVGSQPMWRKSLHNQLGYFDETLTCAGDWDFWLRISNKYRFKHIAEFLGLYYYNEFGIEHGRKIHSLYERYIVGKRYGNPYISVIPQYKSKDNPLVSVIMPAYNAAEYITEAIESVLIQNYRNFELVIINDGSTDKTDEIVAGFKDTKIRYFRQENHGLAATHNTGIRQSRGEFITKLDADDKMTPDFIAGHLQEFEKHPEADLVYCDDCLIDESDKQIRIIKRPEYTDRKLLIRDLFRCGYPIVPFRTCIRRSVFDKIGFFDENLAVGEDYDMMRRFVKHGLKIHHLPNALYLRRTTENSLSRNSTPRKAKCHFELVKRFVETFRHDELFPDVEWDEIPVDTRRLHAKCLAVVTYLAIGQDYINSNLARLYAKTAFEQACSELRDCLEIDPNNSQIRALLQKCELGRQKYQEQIQQAVC